MIVLWLTGITVHNHPLEGEYADFTEETVYVQQQAMVDDTSAAPTVHFISELLVHVHPSKLLLFKHMLLLHWLVYRLQKISDIGIAMILLIAFSFVVAGHSVYLVTERSNQEKRLQLIYGVSIGTYWGVAFFWHMVSHPRLSSADGDIMSVITIFMYINAQ